MLVSIFNQIESAVESLLRLFTKTSLSAFLESDKRQMRVSVCTYERERERERNNATIDENDEMYDEEMERRRRYCLRRVSNEWCTPAMNTPSWSRVEY